MEVERLHVGDTVCHFKGGLYKILAFSTHTETNEKLVTYQSLKDCQVWTRPYDMFMSKVDKGKYPDATQEYRMELVDQRYGLHDIGNEALNTLLNSVEDIKIVEEINKRVREGKIRTETQVSFKVTLD